MNSYATGSISGDNNVGGTIGFAGGVEDFPAVIINCVAVNPSVTGTSNVGRILGEGDSRPGHEIDAITIENNFAFSEMTGDFDLTEIGEESFNGANITLAQLHADGTINGIFSDDNIWATQNGKLPGLNGVVVDMPNHLVWSDPTDPTDPNDPALAQDKAAVDWVSEDPGVLFVSKGSGKTVFIMPSSDITVTAIFKDHILPEFTVGPNPVAKSRGSVDIFVSGGSAVTGTLTVYDAMGNAVSKITIRGGRAYPWRR